MELKLLTYEESGEAYAQGTAEFDKYLPPLVETDIFTLRKLGIESDNEDAWGVRSANLAQAKLSIRQVVEMFDQERNTVLVGNSRLNLYQQLIEQLRELAK